MTQIDLQLKAVVQKFAPRSSGHIEDLLPKEMLAAEVHEITPVLIEAALCFNRSTTLLYSLWANDVLEPVMITHDGLSNPLESKPTFDDWQIIHTKIEFAVLTNTRAALDLAQLQGWLAADPTAYGNALRCVLAVLQGNHRSAIEHYEHACVLMREATAKVDAMVPGLPGLFYALALLCTRNTSGHNVRLAAFAQRLAKQHPADRFSAIVQLLANVQNRQTPSSGAQSFTGAAPDCPWFALFNTLTEHWKNSAKRGRMQTTMVAPLARFYHLAAQANINWYAAEVVTLFRHRNQQLTGGIGSHERGWLADAVSPH